MDNAITNTQSGPNTANPQNAVPADGASDGADFQSTAPTEVLQRDKDDLSVETTGQPLPAVERVDRMNWDPYLWGAGLILSIIVIAWAVRALIRDMQHEAEEPKPVVAATPAKTVAKKTKKPAKKKSAPAKSRKKTTRKRR